MNDADEMVRALHQLADHRPVGEIPFAAITARINRRRRRARLGMMAVAVVAVVGTVLTVNGVVPRSQVASPPPTTTGTVAPSIPGGPAGAPSATAPATMASEWALRGSLSTRLDLLQQATDRGLAEAARYPGPEVTARPLFLGDTAAGRLAVVLVDSAAGDPPWVVVLAGQSGAPVADLRIVGNLGERESASVTRLIRNGNQWFLFTLTDPSLTTMDVSWHPVYDAKGIGSRSWVAVEIADGISVTAAPGQAITAQVRVGRQQGRPVLTAPVVQDSAELNDPSFFPVALGALAPLSGAVGVTAKQAQRVTWLANQLAAATGFTVGQLRIVVLWSTGEGSSAEVLATFGLPGGGTVVAYAGPLMAGTSDPPVAVLPVPQRADAFALDAGRKTVVFAPTRPAAAVTAADDRGTAATGALDTNGFAALAVPGTAGPIQTVTVGASSWAPKVVLKLTDRAHTDPFDLRS